VSLCVFPMNEKHKDLVIGEKPCGQNAIGVKTLHATGSIRAHSSQGIDTLYFKSVLFQDLKKRGNPVNPG